MDNALDESARTVAF